ISYNQPKIYSDASWSSAAVTVANSTTIGQYPLATFVDTNNTIYVSTRTNNSIVVWQDGNFAFPINISIENFYYSPSLFVTDAYDIYVDSGQTYYQVGNWSSNSTGSLPEMYECGGCWGLFVDSRNYLYCSVYANHQVVSKLANESSNIWNIVAGTNTSGNTSFTLNYPRGIYVDIYLNLYVADSMNNRIQKFPLGQSNGITLAGNGATNTVVLDGPTSIVLDADGYLYIVDSNNHRIIGSDINGFRCIAGCSATAGTTPTNLWYPTTLSFDSYGNIFVTDQYNNRIQKFIIATNTCVTPTTIATTMEIIGTVGNTVDSKTSAIQTTGIISTFTIPSSIPSTTSNMYTITGSTKNTNKSTTDFISSTTKSVTQSNGLLSTTTSTSHMLSTPQSCYAPTITLVPGQSSLVSPLQYRKSQDFSITSMIQLDCSGSLSTITKWKITSCTSICSDQVQTDPTITTTLSELYIPAKTLAYGIYQLTLNITMVDTPNLKSSS
ncbi:unnamed protein product, partial [Adineta steineri]